MTSFRPAYRASLCLRAVDLSLHATAAWLLPGHLLQFAPDILLPGLWMHGMLTNRFLPQDASLLQLHRTFHLRTWASFALFPLFYLWPWLGVHALVHALIDRFTHGPLWQ